MKKVLSLILIIAMCAFCLASCGGVQTAKNTSKVAKQNGTTKVLQQQVTDSTAESEETEQTSAKKNYDKSSPIVRITVKNYGFITLKLDASQAPITVANFVKLVEDGFYDGLTFHRIMQGFMIQGGDPLGNGMGGSEETIKGEFLQNGVENNISHERGVISMARSMDPDSASSQFFICDADSTFLDGQYAAFGKVTDGMDVVDKIAADAQPVDNNGTILSEDQPVIEKIEIIK